MSSSRLRMALICFALIGALAFATLEGKYRQAVLILVFGMAARVGIAHLAAAGRPESGEAQTPEKH